MGKNSVYFHIQNAVYKGDAAALKKSLLSTNGNIPTDLLDKNGFSLLHFAASSDETGIAEILLNESNIDKNLKTLEQKTPLFIATEEVGL